MASGSLAGRGGSERLGSIDVLRGLIMVLMALDHVGLMVGRFHSQEMWAGAWTRYESAVPFLTRFVTHFCAPGFFLLMGAGIALAADAREKQKEANDKKQAEYDKAVKEADAEKDKTFAEFKKIYDDLQKKQQQGEEVDPAKIQAAAVQLAMRQRIAERTAEVAKERLKRERDQELAEIERLRDQDLQQIQNDYKIQATLFPPILPLLVGLVVWTRRRIREREGVSRTRMRT